MHEACGVVGAVAIDAKCGRRQWAVESLEEDGCWVRLDCEEVPEAGVECVGDEGSVERETRSCVTAD
jgi:hypothetical protein